MTDPAPSITCPNCGRTSYNAGDVRERFCGYCHWFHDEPRERPEARMYFLSFADEAGNRGCCVVPVLRADADMTLPRLREYFPQHDPVHAPWIAAAAMIAHRFGCNPGGDVLTTRVPMVPAWMPIGVLLAKGAYEALDADALATGDAEPPKWVDRHVALVEATALTEAEAFDRVPLFAAEQAACDHQFVDSPHCLKCGWRPEA